MSLHVDCRCNHCDFQFLGGHGVVDLSTYRAIEFRSICTHCFTLLPIYSEDLNYPQLGKLCFLHSQALPFERPVFDKAQQKAWQRRIKRAKKPLKKKLRLALMQMKNDKVWNSMLSEVVSGIAISVMETEGMIHLDLAKVHCPICNFSGTIKLSFASNDICPKCKQGTIVCAV